MHNKQILVVSDGFPGHYKKTNAVAQIIRKRFPADVTWMNVTLKIGFYRTLLRFYLNRTRRPANPDWLRLFYNIPDPFPQTPPDLIISSGGKTCFLSAWLAAYYQCPNIFVGQTRRVEQRYFTRIVAAEVDYRDDGKHIQSLPATDVDGEVVSDAAIEFLEQTGLPLRPRWTLVLGGDGAGYSYTRTDWEQLGRTVINLAHQHDIRWLVTTSRRTSPFAEELFSSDQMRSVADDVLVWNHDRRPLYNAYLGCADVIVCTEDSGKMLTEAVAAEKPVLCVRPTPASLSPSRHLSAVIRRFEAAGYLHRVTIDELGRQSFNDFFKQYQPPPEPLMKRVREEVDEFASTLAWAA